MSAMPTPTFVAAAACLYVLGPSGVGKSTLARALEKTGEFTRVVPVMTRGKRPGEVDGVDGLFFTESEFDNAERGGDLVATSAHLGTRYAFHRGQVRDAIASGAMPVVEAFAPRIKSLRGLFMPGPAVMLSPNATDWLEDRIRRRGALEQEVEFRMNRVTEELQWIADVGVGEIDAVIAVAESTDLSDVNVLHRVRRLRDTYDTDWKRP